MNISRKWLSQYMDLSDISTEKLADALTTAGLEVEGVDYVSQGTNLVIGEVLTCEDHPDSDHLHVCTVNVGDEVLNIVCGAPNVRAGIKVVVAKAGAVLPEITIAKGSIRGVESNGMICSLVELGVDPKHLSEESQNGIEILPDDAPVGNDDPRGYLGLDDAILDVGLTPNRNDCMAAWAMAKETGAVLNKEVKLPECNGVSNTGKSTDLHVSSETEKCPLFLGKIINHVTIKESPKWMKDLLMAAGVKSINNVVDISNLVMLETGQPLHFYDLSKMSKKEIVVKDGLDTTYTALDGEEYKIDPEDIMITVDGKPVGIAGVMGGDDSKIDDDTTGIIIEAAVFNHVSIRNTARKLNLQTDASIRYQKGLEPMATYKAMDRAVALLLEYADASELEETVQYGTNNYTPVNFDVKLENINTLLGTDFEMDEVVNVLASLDLQPVVNEDSIHVTIPSYRTDLLIEQDITEEVIRMIGYDRLPSTLPTMPATVGALDARQSVRRKLRTLLTDSGLNEAESYTLVSQKMIDHAIMPLKDAVALASPMSEDRKYVRTSILPSLLECVSYNQARSIKDLALFEISQVYSKGYHEERLAITISGDLQKNRWQKLNIPANFYVMKGFVENILKVFGFEGTRVMLKENTVDTEHFHPYRSACVYVGKDLFAVFGEIHPRYAKECGVSACVMMEANLEVILNNKASKVKFTPVSKYQMVNRDYAFVVEESVKAASIISAVRKCGKNVIKDVEIFDVYTGEHVETGKKSIALSVTLQSDEATLTDTQINEIHEKILATLKSEVNAELRG